MAKLKQQVVSGFLWTAGEKFGSMILKFIVGLVLLAHLTPDDYALVAILTVFVLISGLLVDGGFGLALIQAKNVTEKDYTSVFYLNIALATLLYLLLLCLLGFLVWFYDNPEIYTLGPWLFAQGIIMSLGFVQRAKLSREMRFDVLSKMYIIANVVSSGVALGMILTGFGIWSIVGQRLSYAVAHTASLWIMAPWRPHGKFALDSIKRLFRFGSNMLYTGLLTQVFSKLTELVIPKVGNVSQLGLYNKTLSLKDEVANTIQLSIVNVTFPAFSSLQSEDEKLKLALRKVISVISLILFPVMGGLITTSPEFFHLLLNENWWPGIPYFQLFCVSAFFMPLIYLTLNIIKAKGASRTVLKLEIIKKSFLLATVAVTANINVIAMVYGYVVWMAFEMAANVIVSQRFIKYSFLEIARDSLPYLGMTVIMTACVAGVGLLLPNMHLWPLLAVKIIVGITVYLGMNLFFRLSAFQDAMEISKNLFKKRDK